MTTLYIVRHGQTEWNLAGKLQGQMDSNLTELGIKQAKWLSESLKEVKFDAVYSSSSGRAFNTAEILYNGESEDIIKDDNLREINLGDWEGIERSKIQEEYPTTLELFWSEPHNYIPVTGESYQDLNDRVVSSLKDIISKHKNENILIVSHGVVIKTIMAYFENRELKDLWNPPFIYNTSVCKVEINDEGHNIILHGDTSHYKE